MRSIAEAIGGTVQEAQSEAAGHLARFAFAPPRHFVLPAVLLLLSEEPSYGYEITQTVAERSNGYFELKEGSAPRDFVGQARLCD